MSFEPATRRNAFLRLGLSGPAGSGKTWIALLIAKFFSDMPGLADSEAGAAKKYAIRASATKESPGGWRFRHEVIKDKTPDGYRALLSKAASTGIDTLIIDSYSHSWLGALDEVDRSEGKSKFSSGWKKVSPKVSKLVEDILAYPGHLIATMRSKAEYVLEKNDKGQSIPKKIGMAPVARDGTEYEFDLVFDLTADQPDGTKGNLTCTKSRCNAIKVGQTFERDEVPKLVETIKAWLDVGAPMSPVEVFTDRIRLTQSLADLLELAKDLNKLTTDEKRALQPIYLARKKELQEIADLGAEDAA